MRATVNYVAQAGGDLSDSSANLPTALTHAAASLVSDIAMGG